MFIDDATISILGIHIHHQSHTQTQTEAKFQARKYLEQCEDLKETHLTKKHVRISKSEKDQNFELEEQV